MTEREKKLKAARDKKDEDDLAKKFAEQLDPAGIHFNIDLEDNPRLQVFNQVMREQARKKVN